MPTRRFLILSRVDTVTRMFRFALEFFSLWFHRRLFDAASLSAKERNKFLTTENARPPSTCNPFRGIIYPFIRLKEKTIESMRYTIYYVRMSLVRVERLPGFVCFNRCSSSLSFSLPLCLLRRTKILVLRKSLKSLTPTSNKRFSHVDINRPTKRFDQRVRPFARFF